MKRVIAKSHFIALVLCFCIIGGSFAFAGEYNEIQNSVIEEASALLRNTGWSQEEIDDLFTIDMFQELCTMDAVIPAEEKYYCVGDTVKELSKEEFILQVNTINELKQLEEANLRANPIPEGGTISNTKISTDGYLKMKIAVYRNGDNTHEYYLTASFDWLITPAVTKVDIVGIGTNTYLTPIESGRYFNYKADITVSVGGVVSNTYTYSTFSPSGGWVYNAQGQAAKFDLYDTTIENGVITSASNHRGLIQFYADPNEVTSHPTASAWMQYFHQKISVSVTPSISFSSGSISVTPSVYYTQMLSNPSLQFQLD